MPDSPGLFTLISGATEDWDTTVQVSGADFTTTSTSLVNITGLTFAAQPNSLYDIEGVLRCQSTNTSGLQFGWTYSGSPAATGRVMFTASPSVTSLAVGIDIILNGGTSSIGMTTANTDGMTFARGVVITGSGGGNITLQVLKVSSGTATVYIGSILKIKRLA